MTYLDSFQLERQPFAIQPDPAFLFWSQHHKKIFEALRDQVASSAPLTLLTGETGTGKTLLAQQLLTQLGEDERQRVCMVTNPSDDDAPILKHLIATFQAPKDIDDPWQAIWAGVDHLRAKGISPSVMVDDAHQLSNNSGAVFGRLTTGDRGKMGPVPVLLVGQPGIRQKINQPAFILLKSAVGVPLQLEPLSQDEVGPYINSRLQTAGAPADNDIFEAETLPLIYGSTEGVPYLINKLCGACLFLAGENSEKSISAELLQKALTTYDATGSQPSTSAKPDDVIVLQEPAKKEVSVAKQSSNEQPVAMTLTARAAETTSPPAVRQGRGKTWLLGAAVAAMVYLFSPFGPLPDDNGLMVTLYGAPDATDLDDTHLTTKPLTAAEVSQTRDAAASDPMAEPVAVAAEAIALPILKRAYDPATDPAEAYFEEAISSTDREQIAVSYARAAIRGHVRSARYLGQLFETGDGVAFAPEVAAQWYAVADDTTLLEAVSSPDELGNGGVATALFSSVKNDAAEFVWHGKSNLFQLEIGDGAGTVIAQFKTPLTAALVNLPQNAVSWRVSGDAAAVSDWTPIAGAPAD